MKTFSSNDFLTNHSRRHSRNDGCPCKIKEPAVYVRAGSNTSTGTRNSPFSSLAQAQANYGWKTLVVLYSPGFLDGGISLRPGQRLVGDPSGLQPTISNTTGNNDGNGIICNGRNCIKNIRISNTLSSAINYNNSTDLCIKDCTIEQYNTDAYSTVYNLPNYGVGLYAAALEGFNSNNGETYLENVVIRNNVYGDAIHDFQYNGAQRVLVIVESEIYQIKSNNSGEESDLYNDAGGVLTGPFDSTSSLFLYFENNFIHDFAYPDNDQVGVSMIGLEVMAFNGGSAQADIKHSRFENLNPANFQEVFSISAISVGFRNLVGSLIDYQVSECEFHENGQFYFSGGVAMLNETSQTRWEIKNCVFKGLVFTIFEEFFGGGSSTGLIKENYSEAIQAFYIAFTMAPEFSSTTNLNSIVNFSENNYFGQEFGSGVVILPNNDGSYTPYTQGRFIFHKNCFNGSYNGDYENALFIVENDSQNSPGTITIEGEKNNFVGFFAQIIDQNASANYNLARNFWGTSGSCFSGSDCGPYQECYRGQCTGPTFIMTNGPFDVSDPLHHAIKCESPRVQKYDIDKSCGSPTYSSSSSPSCSSDTPSSSSSSSSSSTSSSAPSFPSSPSRPSCHECSDSSSSTTTIISSSSTSSSNHSRHHRHRR